MSNRKKSSLSIIVVLLMIFGFILSACAERHVHKFDKNWTTSETEHWHKCLGDKCNGVSEKGAHDFGGEYLYNGYSHFKRCKVCNVLGQMSAHEVQKWTVDSEPTYKAEGSKHGLCQTCGAYVQQSIPVLNCSHEYDLQFDNDYHWKECPVCGVETAKEQHAVSSWSVIEPATENTEGKKRGVCSECSATVTRVIPVLGHKHSYSDNLNSDEYNHWRACACGDKTEIMPHSKNWIVDAPATVSSKGSKHQECAFCNKTFPAVEIEELTSEIRTVDFYAINDFHGETTKMAQVAGYMNSCKNDNPNTVLINSGDMFQGSMESNSNYGKLLSDCMTATDFDAFVFGNHEFDWGLDNLKNLASNSTVPFLGANIYNWNPQTKQFGGFASDLAQEYVIKTLDNGLKVGVIGVIGKDQITSISSNLVQTIGFKDPLPIIKELATELRSEKECDVVVVSAHAGPQGLVGEKENNQCPSSAGGLEGYVDAVFCAHTHRAQNWIVNGIPFIQGGHNGSDVSNIRLSVDANGNVTCETRQNIQYSQSWDNLYVASQLINNSNDKIKDEAAEVLARFSNSFSSSPDLPRLVCRAIAEYAVSKGHNDIVLAMTNNARSEMSSGNITYSKLYQSLPFDNVVYVAKVKGEDIIKEAGYSQNSVWRINGTAIENDKYYKIAVIDYLLYHQNSNRYYDYFPSAFTSGFEPVALTHPDYAMYNYRFITRDFLRANKNINESDYLINNNHNNSALLTQTVTLDGSSGGEVVVPSDKGTIDNPYTVAEAIALASQSTQSNAASGYVRGTIDTIGSSGLNSGKNGDFTYFYLSDSTDSIYVYRLAMADNATADLNWTEANMPKDGDEILLYAKSMYVYNGSPQIGYCYCVELNTQIL